MQLSIHHQLSVCFLLLSPGSESRTGSGSSSGRVFINVVTPTDQGCFDPQEIHMASPELIQHRGFPFEQHTVTTDDGYILTYHRIPNPGKPPIIALHGMFQSSRDFLINCGRKAFAYYMYDAGYDIWLANARGNSYSRGHIDLNADLHSAYWDFSVDQVTQYDAPALIDYVLGITGSSTVTWVGYSMGSAVALMLGEVHPSYQSKLHLVFLMGTTGYVGNTRGFMRFLAPFAGIQDKVMTALNRGESLPLFMFPIMRSVFPLMCSIEARFNSVGICHFFLYIIAGFNPAQANPSVLPLMLGGTPASLSIKMLSQWYQWIGTGKFTHYNYGPSRNLVQYGSIEPPSYDLTQVTAPVINLWSENDWLAVPSDVNRTISELPNLLADVRIDMDTWNHLDFIYGKDADEFVYSNIRFGLELVPPP